MLLSRDDSGKEHKALEASGQLHLESGVNNPSWPADVCWMESQQICLFLSSYRQIQQQQCQQEAASGAGLPGLHRPDGGILVFGGGRGGG